MIRHPKSFFLLFFVCILFSCAEQKRLNPTSFVNTDAASKETDRGQNFIVGDTNKYAKVFLDSLNFSGYAVSYKINNDTLILNQSDTVFFPVEINFGETVEFVGEHGKKNYSLKLTQLNYTTIRFGLTIFENSEMIEKVSGDANLLPLFFLGAESDEDDASGVSYLATEYVNSNKDCKFSIRPGRNETNELLVKIKRGCNDSRKNIELTESPTFRRTTKS